VPLLGTSSAKRNLLPHSPQTLGIGKGAWKHAHIFVALLMTVAGIVHLVLNWSVYWSYLWERTARRMNRKWELALALLIVVALKKEGIAVHDPADSLKEIAEHNKVSTDVVCAARQCHSTINRSSFFGNDGLPSAVSGVGNRHLLLPPCLAEQP